MSCIICLNEIYFICVQAGKLGSISHVVFLRLTYPAVNLPPTATWIIMVMPWWFIGTNCTVQTNAALLASQVGRYDILACGDL